MCSSFKCFDSSKLSTGDKAHLAKTTNQTTDNFMEFFIGWLQILSRESPALPLKLAGRHCSDSRPLKPQVSLPELTTYVPSSHLKTDSAWSFASLS
ncbi:hypothetical protein CISG_01120 [Coccidioides immitis RMSCC 3703]|uniref:Uncharacterized protein n=2 Tax=Coccidioides immitis TaxID=5501 RepID=A0A0J8QV73_COCIT|nr:hypothetical protein CIRG_01777 [Coccidioides immitis RMSCC 2394]KMU76386.1 hypothetical protein CISG_01120 [Coccidioides immitis RMSCC 3703]